MKQVHLILQGKGGVGKSLVASLITQHFLAKGLAPICYDTDPVNQTYAGYKDFGAIRLELMRDGNIDQRLFDQLIEAIINAKDDATFIVDNGAATFVPLCAYMFENDVAGFFKEHGLQLVIHSVLTGGQAQADTMDGLASLLDHFKSAPVVVWLNEFFGRVERDGKKFEDSKLFRDNQEQIQALIRIPEVRKETFGADMDQMLRQKLTFKEVKEAAGFTVMAKQRLAMTWRTIDGQIAAANLS
ncbi:MAG: conjugal transfer protein TraL [Alphaproteobacteria bacterium]|nr:conjugal transfer protein TraL [Alphaproteobacteria bacterium]